MIASPTGKQPFTKAPDHFKSVNKIWNEGRNSEVWNQTKNIQAEVLLEDFILSTQHLYMVHSKQAED